MQRKTVGSEVRVAGAEALRIETQVQAAAAARGGRPTVPIAAHDHYARDIAAETRGVPLGPQKLAASTLNNQAASVSSWGRGW